MKKICVYLVAIALVFNACTGKGSKLSTEDQARNIYQNTVTIMTGSMMMMFSEAMGKATTAMMPYQADTLEKELNNKLKGFSDKVIVDLNKTFSFKLDSLKKANSALYGKIFVNDLMKSAVEKASTAKLPKGFKPITDNLTTEDINRYVVYMMLLTKVEPAQAEKDPIMIMYKETFTEINKLQELYKNDPEVMAFLKMK